MQKIEIKQLVKGALTTEYGYNEIASTPNRASAPTCFDEVKHGQRFLSKEYASLCVFRAENTPYLTVMHIQGQYTGENDRAYDTRIFYNIDTDSLKKCSFQIGAIADNLPKMQHYDGFKLNSLNDSMEIKPIKGVETDLVENLNKHILQAIADEKRLFIKLNTSEDWKGNGILENTVSKTLFAAIDKLPEILRPVASFALSVDGKYDKDFLKYMLVVLYHGDRNDIALPQGIELNWNDLKNPTKTDATKQEKENSIFSHISIRKYAKAESKNNFFDTELSSRQMLNGIAEIRNNPDKKRDKNYLEYLLEFGNTQEKIEAFIKLWDMSDNEQRKQSLTKINADDYLNSQIKQRVSDLLTTELDGRAEKNNLDLSDIYTHYKLSKESIAETYAKIYFDKKLTNNGILDQIKFIEDSLSQISDKMLAQKSENRIIANILTIFTVADWFVVATFLQNKKQLDLLKEPTTKYSLSDFGKLFENKQFNTYKSFIIDYFKNSNYYKNNSDELCKKPFLEHFPDDKKQELRKKRANNADNYKELFAGITYAEIKQLPVDFKQKIKLLSKNDYSEFIQDNRAECEKQFEYDFFSCSDICRGEIYKLYESAKERFPRIDDSTITENNLQNAFNNAKILNIDLTRCIFELYEFCKTFSEIGKIYSITKQQPDEAIIGKLTVVSTIELDIYANFQKKGYALPNVNIAQLIKSTPQRNTDTIDIAELLDKLQKLQIPFADCKAQIIQKLPQNKKFKKTNEEFIKKYFGKEKGDDNDENTNKPTFNFKEKWESMKKYKTLSFVFVVLFALAVIGVISIVRSCSSKEEGDLQPSPSEAPILPFGETSPPVVEPKETQVKNDSIGIFYQTASKQQNDNWSGVGDTIRIFFHKEKNVDSIAIELYPAKIHYVICNDSTFNLDILVNGKNSKAKFVQELRAIFNKNSQ